MRPPGRRSRPRQIHRYGSGWLRDDDDPLLVPPFMNVSAPAIARVLSHTICSRGRVNLPGGPVAIHDQAFRWLPKSRRCQTCESAHPKLTGCYVGSDDERIAAVETMLIELERLHAAAVEHPHAERGCFFRMADGDRCWCGAASMLDVLSMEAWLHVAGASILIEHGVSPAALVGTALTTTDVIRSAGQGRNHVFAENSRV